MPLVVGTWVVGTLVVGTWVVGALVVGALVVGTLVAGILVAGTLVAGPSSPCGYHSEAGVSVKVSAKESVAAACHKDRFCPAV